MYTQKLIWILVGKMMNKEAVRKVAEKAIVYCMEHLKDIPSPVAWAWEDKLVEIIVEECIAVLDPTNDLTSLREEYGRNASIEMLRNHFGMK